MVSLLFVLRTGTHPTVAAAGDGKLLSRLLPFLESVLNSHCPSSLLLLPVPSKGCDGHGMSLTLLQCQGAHATKSPAAEL